VDFSSPAHLLHPLPLNDGGVAEVKVSSIEPRHFRLEPWPFAERKLSFGFPARHVAGKTFADSNSLEKAFNLAPVAELTVLLSQ
jgi:hypothetical protein